MVAVAVAMAMAAEARARERTELLQRNIIKYISRAQNTKVLIALFYEKQVLKLLTCLFVLPCTFVITRSVTEQ